MNEISFLRNFTKWTFWNWPISISEEFQCLNDNLSLEVSCVNQLWQRRRSWYIGLVPKIPPKTCQGTYWHPPLEFSLDVNILLSSFFFRCLPLYFYLPQLPNLHRVSSIIKIIYVYGTPKIVFKAFYEDNNNILEKASVRQYGGFVLGLHLDLWEWQ